MCQRFDISQREVDAVTIDNEATFEFHSSVIQPIKLEYCIFFHFVSQQAETNANKVIDETIEGTRKGAGTMSMGQK